MYRLAKTSLKVHAVYLREDTIVAKCYLSDLPCEMIMQEDNYHKHLQCVNWEVIAHKKYLADEITFLFYGTVRNFPMLHLAMILRNGTVWDVSLSEKISASKTFLFKLPTSYSCGYHGYSDDKGILNFIEGHLNRKFVQYHSLFNEKGYKTGIKHYIKEKGKIFVF